MNNIKNATKSDTDINYLYHQISESNDLHPLVNNLLERALAGQLTYNHNFNFSIHEAIEQIDESISFILKAILHHEKFLELEGRWRGLWHFCKNSPTGSELKIKVLSCSFNELEAESSPHVPYDQTQIYKKIYDQELGTPGGEPYATLIADFEFDHRNLKLNVLERLSKIASAAFSPIITSPSPQLLGLNNWSELNKPHHLMKIFSSAEYINWNKFREREETRFVYLCLPRSIARPIYNNSLANNNDFLFNEFTNTDEAVKASNYCWMNSAYHLVTAMARAYSQFGWCINIRGNEGGGRIENLSLNPYKNKLGEYEYICPTEICINDQREAELSNLGFLPLCYYKNSDYAVFFGAESLQKIPIYEQEEANENAKISARLPYIMASSRFAHYLKIIARDKIGSFMGADELSDYLNRWILNYVNANKESKQALKAKYPLAEARVEVKESPGKAGVLEAVVWLRPWLQMEELSASLRLVAKIPRTLRD